MKSVRLGLFVVLGAVVAAGVAATAWAKQPAPAHQKTGEPQVSSRQAAIAAYQLPPEVARRAKAYSRIHYWLHFGGFGYGVLVLLVVLAVRLAPRYRDWAERCSHRRWLQAMVFAPLLLLTLGVADLPLVLLSHGVERAYGQSVQSWAGRLGDWAKAQLVGLLVGTLVVAGFYWLVRRRPRRWWFWCWLAALPLIAFVLFVSPYLLEPLFNRYAPLAQRDPALAAELARVAQKAGVYIPIERMVVMEASRKVRALNAYVSGLGPSKRVVVWDTTMQKMNRDQIAFVFGHELGHYVLHHVVWGMGFSAALLLLFLWLSDHGLGWSLRRWGDRWGIRNVADWASLPLLLLWISCLGFLAEPLTNGFSRHLEHEADRFGLEVLHAVVPHSGVVAAEAFQILGEVDLSDPSPGRFVRFWLYGHPPINERIRFALAYDPWAAGRSPRYIH